jgi:hypothetical protein
MSMELIKASREIREKLLNDLPHHSWIKYFPDKDDPDPLKKWNGLEAG